MIIENLDHLVLTVKDIDKTIRFYTDVLGMKKEIFKNSRVALKYSNQKINLHQLGSEFEPKATNVKEGSADLCFIVKDDINDVFKFLQKKTIMSNNFFNIHVKIINKSNQIKKSRISENRVSREQGTESTRVGNTDQLERTTYNEGSRID